MNNRVIIALFILFALIVFFSSLQTVSHTQQAANKPSPSMPNQTTTYPLLTPTATPTMTPIPTQAPIQIQHPGFRVNAGGEAGDD